MSLSDTILTDPLGRTITLHEHTWQGHIVQRHPEMLSHRLLAEQAITGPLEIRISAADPDCRLYFGPGPRKDTMIVVVADVAAGFVKTAHVVKAAKGVVEWSKPTPSRES